MKLFGLNRLAGLMLAATIAGAPIALPAFAQDAPAPAAVEATVEAPADVTAPAPAATEAAAPVEEAAPATPDKGDTTWMLVSTVLVIAMTIPGLALFYGGLVRAKNMLSVLMQCMMLTAMVIVSWVFWG